MRVRLSFPQRTPIGRGPDGNLPPNALYYLAAILRERGHEVWPVCLPRRDLLAPHAVEELVADCDLLGVSANSINWHHARELVLAAHRIRPELPIVLGGIHPTLLPEHVLRTTPADLVVRGEGEHTFPELLDALEAGSPVEAVDGVTYRDADGTIRSTPSRPLLTAAELEGQPVPAFDLLPAGEYRGIAVESSRGCAFNCVFCSVPYRRSFRALGAEAFVDRLLASVAQADPRITSPYGKRSVYILDDCFTTNKKRAARIFELLTPRAGEFRFGLEARADQVTEELARALSRFDLWLIQMGLESGYAEGLARVDKKITLEDIERACTILEAHGLSEATDYAFIVGFPWESRDDCLRTLEFAVYLHMRYGGHISVAWYEPYPGSVLWERREAEELNMGPELYDRSDWREDPAVFKRFRPRLSWDDYLEIEEVINAITALDPKYLMHRRRPEEDSLEPIAAGTAPTPV